MQVWETCPNEVLAVDPSMAMASLSREIELARKEAQELPSRCIIKRIPRLPQLYGSAKKTKRTYDLVVASYVLSEIADQQERRRIVRQLWNNCTDVLVIIEPGTPIGAANIQVMPPLLPTLRST